MKKNMKKDILVMGFAMFAIFFGSGNLIFPPIIGLVSGEQVGWAIIGLPLTGILFPMMALASVVDILPMPKGRGFLDTIDTCLLK